MGTAANQAHTCSHQRQQMAKAKAKSKLRQVAEDQNAKPSEVQPPNAWTLRKQRGQVNFRDLHLQAQDLLLIVPDRPAYANAALSFTSSLHSPPARTALES